MHVGQREIYKHRYLIARGNPVLLQSSEFFLGDILTRNIRAERGSSGIIVIIRETTPVQREMLPLLAINYVCANVANIPGSWRLSRAKVAAQCDMGGKNLI